MARRIRFLTLVYFFFAAALVEASLSIRNARLFDGTGAQPRDKVSILVRHGRIAAIGDGSLRSEGVDIDASGMTVLPGLVDSHVHFVYAPGSALRDDSPDTIRELNRRHLRAYLACGVTTVLDAGVFPEVARDIQTWLAAGHPGPRYLTTGPYVRTPGGYGHPRFGEESTPAEVEAKLDLIQSLGAVGVKIAIESGFNPFGSLETFPPAIRDAIVEGARRRKLPLFVHARSEETQSAALDIGAHAIMHAATDIPLFGKRFAPPDLSDSFVQRMAMSAVYQLTTLSVFDTWPGVYDVSRLDDRLTKLVVPPLEKATARAPDVADRFAISLLGWIVPWTFESTRPRIARVLLSSDHVLDGLRQGQRNLRRLHAADVPIVAATDAPSPWPDAVYHFHGPQLAREIELLVGAGLSPSEAITAATLTPAKMLALDGEIGTVEVGKRADLLIVRGDPLAEIGDLRDVVWTVKDGVARTPEEWMKAEHLAARLPPH